MHHLLCYSSSIAQDAVLASVSALVDEIFTQFTSTVYTYSAPVKLSRMYAFGDSMSQVQIDSPFLRLIGPPNINPFDTAAEPSNLPPINMPNENGLTLQPNDPLGIKVSRAGAGVATCKILLWMCKQYPPKAMGNVRRIRFTSAVTLTQTGWTSGTMTFDQALPSGTYEIVGMSTVGANLFASRLILPGESFRPGCLAQDSNGEYDWPDFAYGNFGSWGKFQSWAPPTVQHIGFGAGAAQTGWIDVIPRGVPGMQPDLAV